MARKSIRRAPRLQVFINAPFDAEYQPLFEAMVFAVIDGGFIPRCTLEDLDGGEVRLDKLTKLIRACELGVHDISCTELDSKNKLPRFNMPFELGLFIGAHRFGRRAKRCLILDREEYRYQKFLSDIGGQDPRNHGSNARGIIVAIRNWLAPITPAVRIPGGGEIHRRFLAFCDNAQRIRAQLKLDHGFEFNDYRRIIEEWLKQVTPRVASPPKGKRR